MFNAKHELADAFPKHKAAISKFLQKDAHFVRLAKEYHEIASELHKIDEAVETPSDAYTEQKKKQRLVLKDQLLTLIIKAA